MSHRKLNSNTPVKGLTSQTFHSIEWFFLNLLNKFYFCQRTSYLVTVSLTAKVVWRLTNWHQNLYFHIQGYSSSATFILSLCKNKWLAQKNPSFLMQSWLHFRVVTDPVGSYLSFTAVSVLAVNFSCTRSCESHLEVAVATADSNRAFHILSFSTSTTEKYLWAMHLQRFEYLSLWLEYVFTILTFNRGSTLGKNTSVAVRQAKEPEKKEKCRGWTDRILEMGSMQSLTNSWWNRALIRY